MNMPVKLLLDEILPSLLKAGEKSAAGYSRLKGIFTAGMNYKNYELIVSTAKNGTIGNIPHELIGMILKSNPENKAGMIKQACNGFVEASKILNSETKEQIKYFQNMTLKDLFELFAKQDVVPKIKTPGIEKLSEQAAKLIEKSLHGILPSGSKVKVSHLGDGAFGTGYRMEFLCANGEKLLKDRALKIYRGTDDVVALSVVSLEKFNQLVLASNENTLTKIIEKVAGSKLSKKELSEGISSMKQEAANFNLEETRNLLKESYTDALSLHGIAAEANSAAVLKRGVGHNLSKTNLIKSDMFDTKNRFSIAQFADENLSKVTSEVNFSSLGIRAGDLHSGNIINGRIIDYGAMQMKNPELMDKTVLKYFKKIMNRTNVEERYELLYRYKRIAQNPKTQHREKILKAMELVQKELTN